MVFRTVWHKRTLAAGTALAAALAATAAAEAASGTTGTGSTGNGRRVTYRGYTFTVPRDWPVIDLAAHPGTCVRFDRSALYLGTPGTRQPCPSRLVGATQAVLVQPASASQQPRSTDDPAAHRITVTAPRITVTAAYAGQRPVVTGILESAGLPPAVTQSPAAMASAAQNTPALPSGATNATGRGFDACTAPSAAAMRSWHAHTPYRVIGIYIGGADRACAQPALTAGWVRQQSSAGWHFIPLYVGPQVAFHGEVTKPVRQATTSAQDAVAQAKALGFGAGTPIYYDMEAYQPGRRQAAMTFFTHWTSELHALGYRSAIYSSSGSGISDLVHNYTNPAYSMPDVIFFARWNGATGTADPAVPAGYWAGHQRVHQFTGGVTERHGAYAINIDHDYADVQLGSGGGGGATGSRQASQATVGPQRDVDAFYEGSDRALWFTTSPRSRSWSKPARLGGTLDGQPSAVTAGGLVKVFYRGADGGLRLVTSRGSGWAPPQRLRMGSLGSAPLAVSTSGGGIYVFWRGREHHTSLWYTHFTPGHGWYGVRKLASGAASAPAPAVSGSSTVSVSWKGTNGRLWSTSRRSGAWRTPVPVPVGQPGTGPHATGLASGEADVVWGGTSSGVWRAPWTPDGGWGKAARIGGGHATAFSMVTSPSSTANAFWTDGEGRLWRAVGRRGAAWGSAQQVPLARAGGGLFTAGQSSGIIDVFWRGADHHLWHARYSPGTSSWSTPASLGGDVG
jgi:hypothetical protein